MSTLNVGWALSKGNDFPVPITLVPNHKDAVVVGRTVTASLSGGLGGAVAGTPPATITLTEDTTTPATARAYAGTFDSPVVDALIALALPEYWLSVKVEGDALVWERVQMIPYRRAS